MILLFQNPTFRACFSSGPAIRGGHIIGQECYPEDVWEGPGPEIRAISFSPSHVHLPLYMEDVPNSTLRFGLPSMCLGRIGPAYVTLAECPSFHNVNNVEGMDEDLFMAFVTPTPRAILDLLVEFCQ